VARHIFQACPVWIYTQSNITQASYSPEYITPTQQISWLSPSRRREAPCEGTNSPRLFTPGETKALAKSKVHQIPRAWVTNHGWSSSLISKIWRTVMNSEHCDWSNLKFAL
jgi:hypothetical protein